MIRVAPSPDSTRSGSSRIAAAEAGASARAHSRRASSRSRTPRPRSFKQRAKDLLSPRGSLAVDERTNVIIARDVAGNLNQIEELIRSLDTQTPQVLIEARIVEATSNYLRDVGIQWGGDVHLQPRDGQPDRARLPIVGRRRRRQLRQQHPDGGPVALHAHRLRPELRGQPARRPSVQGPAARSDHPGFHQQHLQPRACASRPPSRAAWSASSRTRAS